MTTAIDLPLNDDLDLPELELAGSIIIEWPAPSGGALPGWGTRILDARTGDMIPSAVRLVVAEATTPIIAELTQLVGKDGKPLSLGTGLHAVDGKPATAVFRYEVAEMRIRQA